MENQTKCQQSGTPQCKVQLHFKGTQGFNPGRTVSTKTTSFSVTVISLNPALAQPQPPLASPGPRSRALVPCYVEERPGPAAPESHSTLCPISVCTGLPRASPSLDWHRGRGDLGPTLLEPSVDLAALFPSRIPLGDSNKGEELLSRLLFPRPMCPCDPVSRLASCEPLGLSCTCLTVQHCA